MIEILQDYWKPLLWSDGFHITGVAMTLWLLITTCFFGFLLALPLSIVRVSNNPLLSGSVWLFTYIFRGVPLYVQLLIIYSGIYSLDFIHNTATLDSFFRSGLNCTILAFSICSCAYTTEIFAGAIKSIPGGEIEAAHAFGMNGFTLYRRIILPSALRRALPSYSNEVILILHSTAIAFTATVSDILKIARDINSATYASFEAYSIAGAIYAIIAFTLVGMFHRLERRWLSFIRR